MVHWEWVMPSPKPNSVNVYARCAYIGKWSTQIRCQSSLYMFASSITHSLTLSLSCFFSLFYNNKKTMLMMIVLSESKFVTLERCLMVFFFFMVKKTERFVLPWAWKIEQHIAAASTQTRTQKAHSIDKAAAHIVICTIKFKRSSWEIFLLDKHVRAECEKRQKRNLRLLPVICVCWYGGRKMDS